MITLIALSFFFFMLGNNLLSLTNPDEVFYTQTAREMAQQKTWVVPYLFGAPQFEKPVLTYWLIRVGHIIFGVTPFGARFFPALFGLIGALAVYYFCKFVFVDRAKAFFCALVLLSSGLYIGLARTVFTDLIFSVFILMSMVCFFWAYADPARKAAGIILAFIFAGLATLTKGPLGFFIPALTAILFLAIRKELKFIFSKYVLWGLACFLVVALPWYVYMIKNYGQQFIQEFFYNDHVRRLIEAEHTSNDTWFFYPLTALGCMFPWSVFVFLAFAAFVRRVRKNKPLYLFLACWIAVVLVIFQSAHSKLVSYILPMFAALAIITGDFIYEGLAAKKVFIRRVLLVNWAIILIFPAGLLVMSRIYPSFIKSMAPVYTLIFLICGLVFLGILLALRGKLFKSAYLLALPLPVFLFFVFLMHANYEPYVSSNDACSYLLKNYKVTGKILTAKMFARGVRYYTDRDVAVINIRGTGYFSAHPVPYLDTDDKTLDFLNTQPVTYGIVRRANIEDLKRILVDNFELELLQKIADEHVIRITRL